MIIGIVAISKNFAIGKDGELPWHYSADLKFFKETTSGHAVVMGANTWRSIRRPLPNRLNIVLSRSGNVDTPPSVLQLRSKTEVLELSKYLSADMYIIGGATTYEDFADVIDQWIVTFVPVAVEKADTFMPREFLDEFNEVSSRKVDEGLVIQTLQRN